MKPYIWDTGALTLYFANDRTSKDLMNQCLAKHNGNIPQIILLEFYYLQWREFRKRVAKHRVEGLIESKLDVLPLDNEMLFTAGEHKVIFPYLSIVDSILVAFARKIRSIVVTTEIPITQIKEIKSIKLEW